MVRSLSARKAPIQAAQPSEHLLLCICRWRSPGRNLWGGRWARTASVDKVVAGEVVEVLGAYHVAGHNSDRLSHPDSPTGGAAIYPGLQPDALHLMRQHWALLAPAFSASAERHVLRHTNTFQGSYCLR